jgi:hypothetical protein
VHYCGDVGGLDAREGCYLPTPFGFPTPIENLTLSLTTQLHLDAQHDKGSFLSGIILLMVTIASGLSSLSAAANLVKALREGLKSDQIKSDEIAGRVGEIYDYILDSKEALLNAKDDLGALEKKIRSLEHSADLQKRVRFHDQAVWKVDSSNDGEEGPFCPVCWSLNSKLVRPTYGDSSRSDEIVFSCRVHESSVGFTVPRLVCKEHPQHPRQQRSS